MNSIYLRFHGSGGNLNWAFGVGLALIVGFVYLWMRGLYRGKKWAYVLWMFSIASSLVFVSSMMRRFSALPTEWGKVLYVGQGILQLIATVMLVLPVSWRWFYRRPKQGL
ncbi:MAG: hypothetical protein ABIQ96_17985 [Luteolibacter sp.]